MCLGFQYCACVLAQTVFCESEHKCEFFTTVIFRFSVVFYSASVVFTIQFFILLLWFSRYSPGDARSYAGLLA